MPQHSEPESSSGRLPQQNLNDSPQSPMARPLPANSSRPEPLESERPESEPLESELANSEPPKVQPTASAGPGKTRNIASKSPSRTRAAQGMSGMKHLKGDSLRISMPSSLGLAISQLFQLKGYANSQTDAALTDTWRRIAGERIGSRSSVLGVTRNVMSIGVGSAALVNELVAFHKAQFLKAMQEAYPHLKLRDLKFRLKSDLKT